MLNLLLFLAITFTGFILQLDQTYKVHDLRGAFEKSAKDKAACEKLVVYLDAYRGKDPVVLGFKAGTQGLMAKHAWSPYAKLKHLRSSAIQFEEVLKKHPHQAEVRFLRYSIEYYIPRYLNMSDHLQEDKGVFLKSLFEYPKSDLDPEVFQTVKRFLLKHPDHLTEGERKQLQNIKS